MDMQRIFVPLAYLIFDPPGWVSHLCERPSRRVSGLSQQDLISASVAEFPCSVVCQVGRRFLCHQLNFLRLLLLFRTETLQNCSADTGYCALSGMSGT